MKVKFRVCGILMLIVVIVLASSGLTVAYAASQSSASAGSSDIESKPYTAQSDTQAPAPTTELPSLGWYLFKMIISLAVIGGLAFLVLRLFPRNLALGQGGEYISVYDQYALGQNKGIFIAEIGGKVLALGVTDHSISILSEITDADLIRDMRENHMLRRSETQSKDISFSTHISRQISRLQQITQGEQPKTQGKDDKIE